MPGRTAPVAVIGVSHARTRARLRERLHLTPETAASLAGSITNGGGEAVVVVTCNRTEIYLTQRTPHDALARVEAALAELGQELCLPATAYVHTNELAARHLFRVASGLDAVVLGDTHVAAQVRQAHRLARDAGVTGPLLNRLFDAAAAASKRIRSETAISEGQTSIPAAAIAAAARMARPLRDRRLLVIGAGEIAAAAALSAASRGFGQIVVASRNVARARTLADRVGARATSLGRLDAEVAAADVVVSATSAPGFVLTPDTVFTTFVRARHRPLAIFDLAMPRDVDPAIREPLRAELLDLDDLAEVVGAGEHERRAGLDQAERIACEEAERYERWRRSRAATPAIVELRSSAERARRAVLSRHAPALARLTPDERGLVETITAQVVARVLHAPTVELHRRTQGAVPTDTWADQRRHGCNEPSGQRRLIRPH